MAYADVFERAASSYDRVGVAFFSVFGRDLVAAASVSPGESVLDVGTGRGAVLAPAARAVGEQGRAVGVDLAPTMVALTAAELGHLAQVEVRQADATALPAALGTFDAVLSSLVLFFTPDPGATLRHWGGFVADHGRLGLVTVLDDEDDRRFVDLLREWIVTPEKGRQQPDDGPTPFALVKDPRWLDAALAEAGFPDIDSRTTRHRTRFENVEQWWSWAWSHGMREALEMIPPEHHDAFKVAALEELDAHRLPDGALGFHVTTRTTVARRA